MSSGTEGLATLGHAVLEGDDAQARALARDAVEAGADPLGLIEQELLPAIRKAGDLFDEGEYFLPELVGAAQAMKAAMAYLQPLLQGEARASGKAVIGTVRGDIHDIGKTLVGTLLSANGYQVVDLGADVAVESFVARASEIDADLVCASALLTTTMVGQRELVQALRAAGSRALVLVGGAPVTREWAAEIGADGYADSAMGAVALAGRLLGRDR